MLLTHELVERTRSQAERERSDVGDALPGRIGEEVAHTRSMLPPLVSEVEDLSEPILPGTAPSDYERYLRTDELLALQKVPDELTRRDELLFMTVHQSSELWLKLATFEVETAVGLIANGDLAGAQRLLRRAHDCMKNTMAALDMLEHMSPWEYTAFIRPLLGHGSGFDSPGFREVRRVSPMLGEVFHRLRRDADLSLVDLYVQGREHEQLYQLAEALVEWDERVTLWRVRHFKVVERIIGAGAIGTQGTPVELLGRLIHNRMYPELWDVRNELTELAKEQD
jgi:tryptophan 2,3-dioxygenase